MCAKYCVTAHVTRLFQSNDPGQPRVFHGNTCTHDMNIISTASVLPRTPTDVNGLIGVVFLGPKPMNTDNLGPIFHVRKKKIWEFLLWLVNNNVLYADINLDSDILALYPEDGSLPGVVEGIIHDHASNVSNVFREETAGFDLHPASLLLESTTSSDPNSRSDVIMIEKMGVSDPECDKFSGRSFTASALKNLHKTPGSQKKPDLIVYRGSLPISEYNNPDLIPGCFPTLFPLGIGGLEIKNQPVPLSFQQQAAYYLNIRDRSFRYHNSFVFVCLNILQRRQAHLHTHFTVRKSHFSKVAQSLASVDPTVLHSLANRLENEHSLSNLSAEEKSAMSLLKYVNTIAAHIPGSHASKIFVRNEIRNYFGFFGLPHLFFTFNPNPVHSPIFQVMYGDSTVNLTSRFPKLVSARQRAIRLAEDPVAAADFYEFSFKCCFEYLLGWDFKKHKSTNTGGIFGHLRAFYGSSEYTERGTLHGHFLIWLTGGLNPSDVHKHLLDESYQERFFSFFDDIIWHHLPDIELHIEKTFESHIQRPPPPPNPDVPFHVMEEWESVMVTEIKKCGEILQRHVCAPVCHKYGNEGRCRFLFPHEIVEASYFDPDTNSIVLRCHDETINNFNPYILIFCRHNHDLKCILSGKAAKAAMFYISDYITKMDTKTYEMLSLLSRAVARVPTDSVCPKSPVDNARILLHKCLSQFSHQQQIHAQQAAHYIRGFGDGIPSHKTVPMMSSLLLSYIKKSMKTAHSSGNNSESDSDDSDDETEHPRVRLTVTEHSEIVQADQVHHYIYRADTLSHLCFYDFVRYVRMETKARDKRTKNTHETRLGVFKHHILKDEHPLSRTHILIEHTDFSCGDGANEYVPRIVGCSIPRKTNADAWALFALAHFKAFSAAVPVLRPGDDPMTIFNSYSFSENANKVLQNWDAVHECEDERDAERLRKQAGLTGNGHDDKVNKSNNGNDDDKNDIVLQPGTTVHARQNFKTNQYILLLQQANWLRPPAHGLQSASNAHVTTNDDHYMISHVTLQTLKAWSSEIKQQESQITLSRRNALNPDQQIASTNVHESELGQNFTNTNDNVRQTELISNNNQNLTDADPESVVTRIGSKYNLNEKQCMAYRIITTYFLQKFVVKKDTPERFCMFMTGPGGTGKTHVVRAVKTVMDHYNCAHLIRFLAPTGSAANLIDGMTIHKGLGIKIQSHRKGKGNREPGENKEDLSALISVKNRTQLRDEWKNVEFLLVDESSLLSLQLIAQIDHALRFAKERPDVWFGGVALIFAGDLYQYPPVGGSPLYMPISTYARQTNDEIQKRLGRLAWKTVNMVVNFTKQQRMKDDVEYGDAIARLRICKCTYADVELFNTRVTKSFTYTDGIDMGLPDNYNACAIVVSNSLREALNEKKAEACCSRTKLINCYALDKCTNDELTLDHRRQLISIDANGVGSSKSLPGLISLYVGMPVILRTRNLSTELGITNGSQGIVRCIFTAQCPMDFTYGVCVIVEFPHSKVHLSHLPPKHFPVTPIIWTFTTLLGNSRQKLRIVRSQLPIQPAFAVTGHSAQGKTLLKVLVNLSDGGFAVYVAASRATTRQGLCITEPVTIQQLNKPLPHDLLQEIRRLEAIEHNTMITHGFKKGTLISVPDVESDCLDHSPKIQFTQDENKGKKRKLAGSIAGDITEPDTHGDVSPHQSRKRLKLLSPPPSPSPEVGHITNPDTCLHTASHQPCVNLRPSSPLPVQPFNPTSAPIGAGCQWSSANWSCAYDSVFMVLFHMYRSFNPVCRKAWIINSNEVSDFMSLLFDRLLEDNLNLTSSSFFNDCRDDLRDFLSKLDPPSFPRFGPVGASVSSILELVCPPCELICVSSCTSNDCNKISQTQQSMHISFPTICFTSLHDESGKLVTIQDWLHDWLSNQLRRSQPDTFQHDPPTCPGKASSCLLLAFMPSILFLELIESRTPISPTRTLNVPIKQGIATYVLAGVIYTGDFHFSARIIDYTHNKSYTYDGQSNNGCPAAEDSQEGVSSNLLDLDGRRAHILLYSFLSYVAHC